jgi:hypothetical protein
MFTTILATAQKPVATLESVQCTCSGQVDGLSDSLSLFLESELRKVSSALTLSISERYTY